MKIAAARSEYLNFSRQYLLRCINQAAFPTFGLA